MDELEERQFLISEARRDMLFYTSVCDPTYVIDPVHELIASKLTAVVERKIRRLIITVPPRIGKTRLACIEMPTFALGRNPKEEIAIVGYNQTLPLESSLAARDRMNSEAYKDIFGTRITPGNSKIESWGVIGGGKYRAVGIGGGLTGMGCSILLIDDPIKDFEEAHSQTRLDTVWNWYHSVGKTRLTPDGAVVVIMTRWSPDDLVGRLLDPKKQKIIESSGVPIDGEKWEVINMPAISDGAPDPLGRKIGESISPTRWPIISLLEKKSTSLSYIWSALYEGNPVIMGGNYIPVAKIRIVTPEEVPPDLRWGRGWDLATDSKKTSDETAGTAGAFGPDGTFYIRDLIHGRWKWPEARERIVQTTKIERFPIGIEAVAGFKTAYQNLVEILPPQFACTEFGVSKDKLTRALPWINLVAAGKFALVAGPWNMEFIQQAERFSGKPDDEDDYIDSVSLTYNLITTGLHGPIAINRDDRYSRAMAARRVRRLDG